VIPPKFNISICFDENNCGKVAVFKTCTLCVNVHTVV
jgi:hypothetical protein